LNQPPNKAPRDAARDKPGARYREVDSEHAGQRLDNFLLASLKGVPRSHVYRLIRSGQVRVNSGRSSPSHRLAAGDRVRIPPVSQRAAAKPADAAGLEWLGDRIVYEDARLIVIDKPAGMAVHGGSNVSLGCIEALRSLRPELKTLELAHRLDRATSGCLLIAKRRSALRALHALLREGAVEKRYLTLLAGHWQHGNVRVDAALTTRRGIGEFHVSVDEADGKPAVSHFRLLDHYGRLASYMEVEIDTGRTHQIRVHAAHLGHPVVGDERYGDPAVNRRWAGRGLRRMFLHAHSVGFEWPDGSGEVAISVPLPPELASVLQGLASA
jgi:23S rRNA pseudouridine955/2504/2580 synthase